MVGDFSDIFETKISRIRIFRLSYIVIYVHSKRETIIFKKWAKLWFMWYFLCTCKYSYINYGVHILDPRYRNFHRMSRIDIVVTVINRRRKKLFINILRVNIVRGCSYAKRYVCHLATLFDMTSLYKPWLDISNKNNVERNLQWL